MAFDVSADAYDRFMGRYSTGLTGQLADLAEVAAGQRVLDVGCGPGALTTELVGRLGPDAVAAVDPSASFVEANHERHPGVDVRQAFAEDLPFPDGGFDAAIAQLVVHFMADPVKGLSEMARVTRPGGIVAACVWDHGGGRGPLSPFWEAAREIDPAVAGESDRPGVHEGELAELFRRGGLTDIEQSSLSVRREHPTFEDWWEPFTLGVGPAGSFLSGSDPERLARLRERCRELLPPAPFAVEVWAWRPAASSPAPDHRSSRRPVAPAFARLPDAPTGP
jgi:SAM-dependent methyltransferase